MGNPPYFLRVAGQSPTEFWINNPTRRHADMAIANGATGCTNNPSYSQKMIDQPRRGHTPNRSWTRFSARPATTTRRRKSFSAAW